MNLVDLRGLAKLNLCEECYLKYIHIIEPNIKPWMSLEPLIYCRNIESEINLMVMKLEGVFGEYTILSIDEDIDEKLAEGFDIKAYREIKKDWTFHRKIEYLKKKGIIQTSSYKLLHKVRETRNNFTHDPYINIPEKDLELLECVNNLTNWLRLATIFSEKESAYIISNAEKYAERLLSLYNIHP